MTVVSARYPPTTSVTVKKLTEEFNVLAMGIKAVNKKLEMGYQSSGPPVISRSAQRPQLWQSNGQRQINSSFSANSYNTTNPYSSDTCYYCGEIDYRVPRYNVYVEDLRSSLYHRNESNKFCLRSPSPNAIEVRIQPNMTWRENILHT